MDNNEVKFIKTISSDHISEETGELVTLAQTQEDNPGAIIHTHDDNGDDKLYIGEDQVTDQFIIGGESVTTPTRALGGLGESTIGDLKNNKKTVSQILIDILKAPVSRPTAPSNKPSLTLNGPSNYLLKVDSVISSNSFSVTPDRGKWSNQNVYAGEYNDDTNYIITPADSFDTELLEGVYKIEAKGTFKNGLDQQDNYGNTVAGYVGEQPVTSTQKTYYVVEPILINTEDITIMKEQQLVNYLDGVTFTVTVPPEDDDLEKKFRISIPGTFTTFKVEQFNPDPLNTWSDISESIKLNVSGPDNKGYYTYVRTTDIYSTQGEEGNEVVYRITLKR